MTRSFCCDRDRYQLAVSYLPGPSSPTYHSRIERFPNATCHQLTVMIQILTSGAPFSPIYACDIFATWRYYSAVDAHSDRKSRGVPGSRGHYRVTCPRAESSDLGVVAASGAFVVTTGETRDHGKGKCLWTLEKV